jgi:hypothetical protein
MYEDLVQEPPGLVGSQVVELVGTHVRIAGTMDVGAFQRLTDYVNLQPGTLMVHDVTLLNRRGQPTADRLPRLAIRQRDVTLIAQRTAAPSSTVNQDVFVQKTRRSIVAVTTGHIVEGTVSLYPGAELEAYLQAGDPPFLPLIRTRVRWLADRRLKTLFEFVLLNRAHVLASAGVE